MNIEIPGEEDFLRYHQSLQLRLDGILKDNRPCHYGIKSSFFPHAYTFNFVVPEKCPEFFYDRSAEVSEGWREHDIDSFIDNLPEQYLMELPIALIKGLLERVRDHGTGPNTRFFTTAAGAHWLVSARMLAIVAVENLSGIPSIPKPAPADYTQGVSYSTKL